jgi:hypothetical protein
MSRLRELGVAMGRSSRTPILKSSLMRKESSMSFRFHTRVVERKNRTLIEGASAMLDEYKTPVNYWAKAVHTACHAINRLYLHKMRYKTAYELLTGKKPKVHYFRVFGSKCFILNKKYKSSKFAPKVDEGFMLGYATNEHGYCVFNKTTSLIEIVVDVTFDETDSSQKEQVNVEIVGKEEAPHQAIKKLVLVR